MFFFPGRLVAVSLTDGSVLRGTTRWSYGMLRLRDVEAMAPGGHTSEAGRVIVQPTSILTIQVLTISNAV